MELPPHMHDDFIQHQVDDPAEQHLREVLHTAEVGVSVKDLDDANQRLGAVNGSTSTSNSNNNNNNHGKANPNSNEHTPLLVKSPRGSHVIDLDKVEEILTSEETAAIEEDARLSTMAIVREEAVVLTKLGIPMILLALLEFIPNTALAIMVGHVSPDESTRALAGYNLADMAQGMFLMFVAGGIESATSTFCSQAFGGKRMVEFWLYCQAALVVFAVCVPFVLAALLNGPSILRLLGQDPAISDLAGKFLTLNSLAVPFTVVSTVMTCALQAQNVMVPAVVASAVSWSVGLTVAYVLSYHTSLGYLGVALAGPTCTIVKTLTLSRVVLRSDAFVSSWPGWRPTEALALVPKISTLSVSSVLMITFQNVSVIATSLLAGALPNSGVMLTASNIFLSTIQLSYMPMTGVAVGGAIRLGNALGAGKARRAALLSRMIVTGTVSISSVVMVVAVFAARSYASAFTPDPEAIRVAVGLVHKLLVAIPLVGFTLGVHFIMRGCGKQLLNAKLNFVSMIMISLPLAWVFSTEFHGGLTGLWLGNLVGMASLTVAGTAWLCTVSWKKLAHEAKHNTHLHVAKTENDEVAAGEAGMEAEKRQPASVANAF